MIFEKFDEKIFDDIPHEARIINVFCGVKNSTLQFKIQDLTEYAVLEQNIYPNESSRIQAELGFKVIDFDGDKIFQGRKKGLQLYGLLRNVEHREIFLFSCGEYQPGRSQIFLEGRLAY